MKDRELLELAAKAAGMNPSEYDGVIYSGFGSREWNPLLNDGDALRLAVKLKLRFKFSSEWAVCEQGSYVKYGSIRTEELNVDDPYAATRRAIVRAAAEIGKGMK